MKELKVSVIATIITALIICSCAYTMPAHAEEHGEFYPLLTIVVNTHKIDDDIYMVDCRDKDSNIWSFYDDEGTWSEGDIANLLMWDIDEKEEEHEIVEVYWEEYTEDIELFFRVMGWR